MTLLNFNILIIMKKYLLFSSLCVFMTLTLNAQKADTSSAKKDGPAKAGPKPYGEVITKKSVSQKGVFTVHFQDDKYLYLYKLIYFQYDY